MKIFSKRKVIIIVSAIFAAFLILIGIIAVRFLNPFNIGISPLRTANDAEQSGRRLEITFSYEKQRMVASSQFVFWIEDMDGNYVDTLYVTRYTAIEGYHRRPKSLPQWVAISKPGNMPSSEIDAIAGATPKSGDYRVYWDFTDSTGNLVTGSQYRYFIEATMYNDDNAVYSGVITISDEAWHEYPAPEYSVPASEYKSMIGAVRVAYHPN